MGSIVSGFLGGKEAPPPVYIPPAPQPAKQTDEMDPEAKRLAAERLAAEKARRGRAKLRTDLSVSGAGGGSGIAIPA